MKKQFLIIICSLVLILGFTLLWFNNRASAPDDSGDNLVACTEEAMICPDGISAVGRSGPNCEFDDCPETPLKNEDEL